MTNNLIDRDNKVIAGIEKIRFFPVAPIGGKGCYIVEENGRENLDFEGAKSALEKGLWDCVISSSSVGSVQK